MGHRNSSAHFHDAGHICFDRSGVARTAAESSASKLKPLKAATPRVGLHAAHAANRALVWVLLACVRFYQAVFAPLMPLGCKFYPSCSRYAAEAIARHGAMQGTRLALARLWRCRPFTQGGVDPVPDLLPDVAELLSNGAGDGATSEVQP
jgi:uncharacterized protein